MISMMPPKVFSSITEDKLVANLTSTKPSSTNPRQTRGRDLYINITLLIVRPGGQHVDWRDHESNCRALRHLL